MADIFPGGPNWDGVPFILTDQLGGPLDTLAFSSGWLCATIHALLSAAVSFDFVESLPETAAVDRLIPQIDLIAMHNGFTITTRPIPDLPEACMVKFTYVGDVVGGN